MAPVEEYRGSRAADAMLSAALSAPARSGPGTPGAEDGFAYLEPRSIPAAASIWMSYPSLPGTKVLISSLVGG